MEYFFSRSGMFKSSEHKENMKSVRKNIQEENWTLLDEEYDEGSLT